MGKHINMRIKKKLKYVFYFVATLLIINMLLPTKIQNHVEGCGKESYNQKYFWHPWGDYRHAGIDIFAKKVTQERRIPFEITADPFYSESNVRYLERKMDEYKSGAMRVAEHSLIEE